MQDNQDKETSRDEVKERTAEYKKILLRSLEFLLP